MSASVHSVPRSMLHSMAPMSVGTPEVESLTSYFCRLANSHACTTNDLAQFIIDTVSPGRWLTHQNSGGQSRFVWHERSVSGLCEGALGWASSLSELAGLKGLDRLTLLPLKSVLAPKGLMAQQARWCPHCLDEDQRNGRSPYFRLSWDIGLNKRCVRHETALISQCQHCEQTNVRHAANFVVPGWCTHCDHFLGAAELCGPKRALTGDELLEKQQAERIGSLLAVSSSSDVESSLFLPDLEALHSCIDDLVHEMDGGVCAHFAKRLGVRKSTVHYWKTARSLLTFDALTRLSLHCNVSLESLVQGSLETWTPPNELRQLALKFCYSETERYRVRRKHNWVEIKKFLTDELASPVARSLAEIARDLEIDDRHLYIQVTNEARQIGDRYVQQQHQQAMEKQSNLRDQIRSACVQLRQGGVGVTIEAVASVVGTEPLKSVRNLYTVISSFTGEAANDL